MDALRSLGYTVFAKVVSNETLTQFNKAYGYASKAEVLGERVGNAAKAVFMTSPFLVLAASTLPIGFSGYLLYSGVTGLAAAIATKEMVLLAPVVTTFGMTLLFTGAGKQLTNKIGECVRKVWNPQQVSKEGLMKTLKGHAWTAGKVVSGSAWAVFTAWLAWTNYSNQCEVSKKS